MRSATHDGHPATPLRTQPSAPDEVAPCRGFSLIEILFVLAIVAVLASLAFPSYADHLRRARIVDAAVRLADHRARLEQHFLDFRRYDDGNGQCGVMPPAPAVGDTFLLGCEATPSSYVVVASGVAGHGMDGFRFTLDHTNGRATPAVPAGWTSSEICWVSRRDGSCF